MSATQESLSSKIDAFTTLCQPAGHELSELIILCTWLGAQKNHIAKYTTLYQALAPHAAILLLESSVRTITPSYSNQRKMMAPAVTVIENVLGNHTTKPKILLHAFSNGGSNSASQLLLAHFAKTDRAMPLHGLLIDSSPDKGEYWKSFNAIRSTLPQNRIWKILGPVIAHMVPLWMYTGAWLGFYPTFEQLIWDSILDEKLWEIPVELGNQRKIAYLWGKMDKVIWWEDIVQHGIEAEGKGWDVKSIEFEASGHCEHYRMHPEKYVGVVEAMWS